jgi:hypothetical protein
MASKKIKAEVVARIPPVHVFEDVHQEASVILRPICHSEARWTVRHSMKEQLYSFECSDCGKTHFQFQVIKRGTTYLTPLSEK